MFVCLLSPYRFLCAVLCRLGLESKLTQFALDAPMHHCTGIVAAIVYHFPHLCQSQWGDEFLGDEKW